MSTLTKEQAVKEIEAIYKLAGLSGCFIFWDIKEFVNPELQMIDFPEDGSVSEMQVAAFTTSCVSPLYRGIMCMLSVTGIAIGNLTPRPGETDPMTEYLRASLGKMGTGTIKLAYDKLVAPDKDIPVEFKSCIQQLLSPLNKI